MAAKPSIWTYVKNYKFNSLLIKNFLLIFLLLTLPFSLFHYYVFKYNHELMREEIGRANTGELTRIRDTLDLIIEEVERLTVRLAFNQDVQLFAGQDVIQAPLVYSDAARIRRLQELLKLSTLTNPYIQSIYLYGNESDYLLGEASAGKLDKYDHDWWLSTYLQEKDNKQLWSRTLNYDTESGSVRDYSIHLFRSLQLPGNKSRGVMMVSLDMTQVSLLMKKHSAGQELYILDRTGHVVFSHNPHEVNQPFHRVEPDLELSSIYNTAAGFAEDKDRIISSVPSAIQDWTYLSTVPISYDTRRSQLESFMVSLIILGALSSFVLALLISLQVYRPIRTIHRLLEQGDAQGWQRDGRRSHGALNEIKYIAESIMHSTEKKKEMEEELDKRYAIMRGAQSIALQSQINPHFLYNSLESINWKVMRLTKGKNEASEMIQSLSRLLRLSLQTEDNIIPLRTEMEHVKLYTDMLRLQYKEGVDIQWKLDDTILNYQTVKLTLQPLVENAFFHGIRPSGRPGVITISGGMEEEVVVLNIEDNGCGISPQLAGGINQAFQSDEIRENTHIGLRNVNLRIRLIFGKEYGLKINAGAGGGTRVEMRFPPRL